MKEFLKKYKVLACALGVVFLVMIATIVYSASQRDDHVINPMQVGNVSGEIVEVFEADKPLIIGQGYSKKPTIKNTGNMNLFVRVMIFPEITSATGVHLPSAIAKELLLDIDSDWLSGGDGYYYYSKKVSPKNKTAPVFTSVRLNPSLSKKYENAKLTIQLKSETISANDQHYRTAFWNLATNQAPQPANSPRAKIDALLKTASDKK